MTEAEKKIAETKTTDKSPVDLLFSRAIANPKLNFYSADSLFTEPIMLEIGVPKETDHLYQLSKFDALEAGIDFEYSLYENTLMSYLLCLRPKHRKPFIEYQASIHENPILWLNELMEFLDAYYPQVREKGGDRLFDTYVDIIKSVMKEEEKKDKKYAKFNWLCEPTKLIEVALAFDFAKMVEYPTGKRLETQNKYIESFLHALSVDIPIAKIETLKKNILRKSSVENTCLQDMYTALNEELKVISK